MKERPILYSGPMVRRVLDDSKTHTRRIVSHPLLRTLSHVVDCGDGWWGDEEGDAQVLCPYGRPGDRLWVRETFAHVYNSNAEPKARSPGDVAYKADAMAIDQDVYGTWKPSIHMPRWASRILLEIISVRVERLQDISNADALAEGVNVHPDHHRKPATNLYGPVQAYRDLWEQIHGAGSWDANPLVWAIEFRRLP